VEALSEIGMDRVAEHEENLMRRAMEGLNAIDGVAVYGGDDVSDLSSRVGVMPFMVHGASDGKVASILSAEYAIGVRNGCFCAQPYVTRLLGVSSEESRAIRDRVRNGDRRTLPGLVRASFGLAARADDVDRLISAVRDIVEGRTSGEYEEDKRGMWVCRGFDPDVRALFSSS
jgi:cysteine desulfurase/selenocysteine lyase